MDEMAEAADVDFCRRSTAGFASGLVEIFKVTTIKVFLAPVQEVAADFCKGVPAREVQLAILQSGYHTGRHFMTTRDDISEKVFFREPMECERRAQSALATDWIGSSGTQKCSFS